MLDESLAKAGLTDYRYTSLVKCPDFSGDKPESDEIKACRRYLDAELSAFKPTHIMTLGATVSKVVAGKSKITEVAGQLIEKDGYTIIPCYSPSYPLRDPSKAPEFDKIIKRLSQVAGGKTLVQEVITVRIIDHSSLSEFVSLFEQERDFIYDLETSGLDHYSPDSYINCIGFHLPASGTTWVLPVRKAPTLSEDEVRKLLKHLESLDRGAIGHNIKFDSLWLRRKFGIKFRTVFDTMLAHHLLDENSMHGLKYLARVYLNAPDYDIDIGSKLGFGVDAKELFTYCGWDCYYTYQLKKMFAKELMHDKALRDLYYKMVVPISRLFEEIEEQGHFVRMDKLHETRQELHNLYEAAEASLNKMVGRKINWNSPKQVGEVLYGDLGLPVLVTTDTGAPGTGEEALAGMDHPIAKLLENYRGHGKNLSTYAGWDLKRVKDPKKIKRLTAEDSGWPKFMVGEYLFLSTKIHGTVTGRFSSRLHQVPRDGTIRNLISASPGWTFVQADLSQAELRVVAIVSGDPELIDCYRRGIDVHWRTAINNIRLGASELIPLAKETLLEALLGDQPVTVQEICDALEEIGHDRAIELRKQWKEIRKQAKGINFGYVYGMGSRKFVEYAKVKYGWDLTIAEAEDIRNAFFATYSFLSSWHERQRALVKLDGFVRNLAGRKRRLPGIHSPDGSLRAECERQAINAPIQGFIGDYKTMAMLSVAEGIPDREVLKIKGEVHDSVLMWVKDEYLDETLPKIKYCMENPPLIKELGIELPVSILVDIEVGVWGAGKTWKGN